MKTLILGIGNEIRGDDGIGIHIAEKMRDILDPVKFDVRTTHGAGITWIDMMEGYEKAVIIDAMVSDKERPGTLLVIPEEKLRRNEEATSLHQMGLCAVLDAGRKIGVKLPSDLKILGIYIKNAGYFSKDITEKLLRAIPDIVKNIRDNIEYS
ncbi:MAG: hydrogenase maturation protease [Candidatus Omnitrophota bacterium]